MCPQRFAASPRQDTAGHASLARGCQQWQQQRSRLPDARFARCARWTLVDVKVCKGAPLIFKMIGGLMLWLSMVHGYNYDMRFFFGNDKRRAARFVRKQTEPTTRWHLMWINWGIWKQKWVSLTC